VDAGIWHSGGARSGSRWSGEQCGRPDCAQRDRGPTCRNRCWILALPGSPRRNQIRRRAVREAGLHAARSQADPSHRVLGTLWCVQGRTPEMGALHTHGQWTDLFYICTDSFPYFILVSMSTWSVRLVGRSSLVPSLISRTDACVRCWATSPLSVLFLLFHPLLASDYDYGSKGSRLMVLPNYYLVSSYKSALCAAMECHLRVSGLFLFIAPLSESLSFIAPLSRSTVHCSCSTPHVCLVPVCPLHCLVPRTSAPPVKRL
jgi:hypothetical protein